MPMRKTPTPSHVLTLKLNTTPSDEKILAKRFFIAAKMQNAMIAFAKKRLRGMRQDLRYRELMSRYVLLAEKRDSLQKGNKKSEELSLTKKELTEICNRLSDIRREYGLSEYQFHAWIKEQQDRYSHFIDALTAQRIASDVWMSVENVLFRKGKTIHFKKSAEFVSVCGKNNTSGIRYTGGKLEWIKKSGLSIQPQLRKNDAYAREALQHRVKYCRIVRLPVGTKYHYYLQLVLEGTPPQKHKFLDTGRVGIDPGVSSEAVVSKQGCILTELAPGRKQLARDVKKLQRRMDRSRRANNPDNYNPDGTVIKHPHRFKQSKAYRKDRFRLASVRRQNAAYVKQQEEILANTVLCKHGSDIITEVMSYKGLQRRAKETTVSEKTGRFRSKKRFGSSIAGHAPARFLGILERKLGYINKTLNQVNTVAYRASQYNHAADTYEKHELSERSKKIDGHLVQRDLYSAFLLMCAEDLDHPSRELCLGEFDTFLINHDTCIKMMLNESTNPLSSFGLKDFAV